MRYLISLLILFLVTCSFTSNAQNYFPVYNGNTLLFQNNGDFEVMHVDSIVAENNGLSYYFIQVPDLNGSNTPGSCLPYKGTWAGHKLFSKDSICTFFNYYKDSIFIIPKASIGKSWKMYTYSNGNYIEATVSNKEWATVVSLQDSVKTITLQLKDPSGNPIDTSLNGDTLKLSKNHGIVQLSDLRFFPNSISMYTIVGLSNPKVGQQLLGPRQIFNYDIGDEFHYWAEQFDPSYEHIAHTIYTTKKVTAKYTSSNTDTIIYSFDQVVETVAYDYNTSTSNTTYD